MIEEPIVLTTAEDAEQHILTIEITFPDTWIMGRQYLWLVAHHIDAYGRIDGQIIRANVPYKIGVPTYSEPS